MINVQNLEKTKLHGSDRPGLVGEDSAKFCVACSAQRITTAVNLGFIDPEPLFFH
jgi:hypothetical protein